MKHRLQQAKVCFINFYARVPTGLFTFSPYPKTSVLCTVKKRKKTYPFLVRVIVSEYQEECCLLLMCSQDIHLANLHFWLFQRVRILLFLIVLTSLLMSKNLSAHKASFLENRLLYRACSMKIYFQIANSYIASMCLLGPTQTNSYSC